MSSKVKYNCPNSQLYNQITVRCSLYADMTVMEMPDILYTLKKSNNLLYYTTILHFRTGVDLDPREVQPVWWDPDSNGGFGSWRPEPCTLLKSGAGTGMVWFTCHRIGYYGYQLLRASLRGSSTSGWPPSSSSEPRFRFHHPVLYVGGVVCLVLLLVTVLVYVVAFSRVRAATAIKHAFVNIWLAMAALVFFFVSGVHQVRNTV